LDEGSRDAAFAAIYPDLAAKYSLRYYPSLMTGVEDKPEFLQTDGLHPTAKGVKIIAGNLAQFLEHIVESNE
jgi:acyl-CoA thioesterase-1